MIGGAGFAHGRWAAEVNMLEEDLPSGEQSGLAVRPYEIRTVRLPVGRCK